MPKTKYANTGLGTSEKQQPIAVKYPPAIDQLLRSLPNRSDYIRKAVISQMHSDGLLDNQIIDDMKVIGLLSDD
ncbi:MAG TPA: hypothetical protein VE956_02120 [Nodularia sp. (in: cyanobacteria)]|nr:hypothetical protein [Nodularia sp. (in: cyanobacteria)]